MLFLQQHSGGIQTLSSSCPQDNPTCTPAVASPDCRRISWTFPRQAFIISPFTSAFCHNLRVDHEC